MNPQPSITSTAALIADPARAAMLMMLVDGRARPAGELAYAAGVTAQTTSSHLAKLLAGGLVAVETQGRHRYYRLAGAQVRDVLKLLASVSPIGPVRRKAPNKDVERLRFARCCYDHLAGSLGVEINKGMLSHGYLAPKDGKAFIVTPAGMKWFGGLGLDVNQLAPGRHGVARQCLDWTEREHHLAGPLGARFLSMSCTLGWFRRPPSSRAVEITSKGWEALKANLGIDRRDFQNHHSAEKA